MESQNNRTVSSNTVSTPKEKMETYSDKVQKENLPTKYHAIVLDIMEGLTNEDYAVAVAKIVRPKDMTHISRISQGRLVIYFSTRKIADDLIENKTKVKIGTHELEMRPLVTRAKRITISNFPPYLPTTVFLKELANHNVIPISQVTQLKAAISVPELSHMLSLRRQMLVKPEDVDKLPDRLLIRYDDFSEFVYLSNEKLTCFLCKEDGHLAKYCKNDVTLVNLNEAPTLGNAESTNLVNTTQQGPEEENQSMLNEPTVSSLDFPEVSVANPKKHLLSISSANSSNCGDPETKTIPSQVPKKRKTTKSGTALSSKAELATKMEYLKEHFEVNPDKYPLNLEGFITFCSDVNGKSTSEILQIISNLDAIPSEITKMLDDLYPMLNSSSLKSRFTRLGNKIKANVSKNIVDVGDTSEDILSSEVEV